MAKRIEAERALVLAPHTDDGELGCGGTICRMLEEAVDVYYVAFSTCRRSLPEGCPPDTLEREVRAATLQLGMGSDRVILFDFDVREFDRARQAILDELVRVGKKGIVSFPNFAYWPMREMLYEEGRAPREFGYYDYEWYNTPNRRFPSILDFEELCASRKIKIEKQINIDSRAECKVLDDPNLNADVSIMVIAR